MLVAHLIGDLGGANVQRPSILLYLRGAMLVALLIGVLGGPNGQRLVTPDRSAELLDHGQAVQRGGRLLREAACFGDVQAGSEDLGGGLQVPASVVDIAD